MPPTIPPARSPLSNLLEELVGELVDELVDEAVEAVTVPKDEPGIVDGDSGVVDAIVLEGDCSVGIADVAEEAGLVAEVVGASSACKVMASTCVERVAVYGTHKVPELEAENVASVTIFKCFWLTPNQALIDFVLGVAALPRVCFKAAILCCAPGPTGVGTQRVKLGDMVAVVMLALLVVWLA